jgi:hypothetical protein
LNFDAGGVWGGYQKIFFGVYLFSPSTFEGVNKGFTMDAWKKAQLLSDDEMLMKFEAASIRCTLPSFKTKKNRLIRALLVRNFWYQKVLHRMYWGAA